MGLGIFVTVGMVFFIAAIYFIGKKQQLFSPTFRITGIFKDVRGLQAGDNVRLSGINVGIIEDITIITDTTVKVDLQINEDTRKFIRKDASAIISSDGLMGNKILLIMPGTSGVGEIQDNGVIRTIVPVSMDDILVKLKVTGDNAAQITDDLAVIMGNIRSGKGTIGKLFFDSTFATNLDKTIVNLKKGAHGFSQNMEAAKQSFLLKGLFKRKKDKKKDDKKKEVSKN